MLPLFVFPWWEDFLKISQNCVHGVRSRGFQVWVEASPPPTSSTFSFTAEQIVSLVTNVVVQIAQPQLCTKNLPEKQVQAKSDLSKQIAETAKKCLGVNIQGKDVFESIISRPAAPPPAPFVFSSTLVEKKKARLLKASTVLNKVTPQLVTPSTNSTKSTKAPSLGPNASLPPSYHHHTRHLPNHHQTNHPPRVLVDPP